MVSILVVRVVDALTFTKEPVSLLFLQLVATREAAHGQATEKVILSVFVMY